MENSSDFWTGETSVLLTSFWGWIPETWGTVGWSNVEGETYRDNLLTRVSNPFIAVIYVTRDPEGFNHSLVGKVAGFFLMSHERGHRNKFMHPIHYGRYPEKWEHSLRALRAFSYIGNPLLVAKDVEPEISRKGQAIARWGKLLEDPAQVRRLRESPWCEVPVYRPDVPVDAIDDVAPLPGFVRAGPTAVRDYAVSPVAADLKRFLYVLRLEGDTDAYLGKSVSGRQIVKIGLSVQPEIRRATLQKSMPIGAFRWRLALPSAGSVGDAGYSFEAAVAGEYAMKLHLCKCSEHLGGEFYLAAEKDIAIAWKNGHEAAGAH